MDFVVELRYLFPALINFMLYILDTYDHDQGGGKLWDLIFSVLKTDQHLISKLTFSLLSIALLLLFLINSIKLPLTINRLPNFGVRFSFSIALTIYLIVSIILSPPLFCLVFLALIAASANLFITDCGHQSGENTQSFVLLVELRYALLPLINFTLYILDTSDHHHGDAKLWELVVAVSKMDLHPISKLAFCLVSICLPALFLFVSIRLSLTVNRVQVSRGAFSMALTISLIASIILPPLHFWLVFVLLMVATNYSHIIVCTAQRGESTQQQTPQVHASVV